MGAAVRRSILALAALAVLAPLTSRAEPSPVAHYVAKGSFDEVRQLLVIAIENQGLVIDHRSNVGEMLARTGKDLGATTALYEHAEVLEFCSANYSRKMMEADPRLLAVCPFGVGIYTLPGESERVHLVYRRLDPAGLAPDAAQALKRVDDVLKAIVEEATQ